MGVAYRNGLGVEQNFSKAVKWYQLAADQNYAFALVNLGYAYEHGEGVPINIKLADQYYERAADQGVTGTPIHY
jgi:TPR repeat protein